MMKKILLINPPVIEELTLNTQPVPLGVLSIAQYLRQKGHNCKVINLCNCKCWGEVRKKLCFELSVDYVGIPCFTRQRFSVVKLAELVKEMNPRVQLWLGGPHATFLDIDILKKYKCVDFIIRGEGEETAACLVSNSSMLHQIDGITFRDNFGEVIRNKDRKKLQQLEKFPVPLQSVDELEELNQSDSLLFHFPDFRGENLKIAPLISSRGCNGNCTFCCNRAYWGKQRYAEFRFLKNQLDYYFTNGIVFFDVYDDDFTENRFLVHELTKYILDNNMDIHWWCSSRVDSVDIDLLRAMKQAGCFMISYGVESGSQLILNNIKKGIKIKRILKAGELAKQVGLDFRVTISIGHTGENMGTIQETINLLNCLKPKQIALFILKVYPGTPIYEQMINSGLLSDEYWFDEKLPIVPFFTVENSKEDLVVYRNKIENSINATILERYEDELGSVELTLDWRKRDER
ncbi:radical SAM protein [Ruminococcus sp. AM46-18]|nr:radical SAM protein [Ruminococcus sp. AM46-18]